MAEGELREEVRGKAGNALYIGPRSGDVETTPAIQQLTLAILSETQSTQQYPLFRNWHVSLPWERRGDTKSQPMTLRHVVYKPLWINPKFCQYPGRSFERRGNWWDSRKLLLWFIHRDRPRPRDQIKPGNHPRRLRDITDKETVNYNQQGLP